MIVRMRLPVMTVTRTLLYSTICDPANRKRQTKKQIKHKKAGGEGFLRE